MSNGAGVKAIALFWGLSVAAWGGQSLVLSPGVQVNVADPTQQNTQSWRVEFQMSNWSLPAAGNYADYIFELYGEGASALLFPDGRLAVNDWRDSVSPSQPCFLNLPSTTSGNVLVRIQRDATQMQFSCEMWNVDGSGYQQNAVVIGSFDNWTSESGQIGSSTTQAQLGFLRVFTSVVPEGSQPPPAAEIGDWSDWKFDGNLNDDSGNQHNGTLAGGQATYVSTPGGQTVTALVSTVGAPYWTDVPSVRAGFPVQLDGTHSYSMNDQSAAVSYQWSQTGGPATVIWNSQTIAQPTIQGLIFGSYTFQLVVTDVAGNTATCVQEIGAVATDNNGVVVYPDPRLETLLGPAMILGGNPWQWFDIRDYAMFNYWADNYQVNGGTWRLETDQTSINGVPRNGTIFATSGNNTIYGAGTNFEAVFCGGQAGPAAGLVYIVPLLPTGTPNETPRPYPRLVASCQSDTALTMESGWIWERDTVASPGVAWGTFGLCTDCGEWANSGAATPSNINFYDNALAHYALYYRSGIQKAQTSARWLADRWYRSPWGGLSGIDTAPRDFGLTSAYLRATVDGGNPNYDLWPSLRYISSLCASAGFLSGIIGDVRETSYCLAYTSEQALLDPDPVQQAGAQSTVAGLYGAMFGPQQQPNGNYISTEIEGDYSRTFSASQGSRIVTLALGPPLPANYCGDTFASTGTIAVAADRVTVTGRATNFTGSAGMYIVMLGTLNGQPWSMVSLIASTPAPTANELILTDPWRGDVNSVSPTAWRIYSDSIQGSGFYYMFFGQTDSNGNYPNPPVPDTDNWYWCTVTAPNTMVLDKPYTGNTSNGNTFRRPTWQNLTGTGSQPFFNGIAGWALNYAAEALEGYDNNNAANYRTSLNKAVEWIWNDGRSPVTKGLVYGLYYSNCANLTILPADQCAQGLSGSSNERAYDVETNASFAQNYLNTRSASDLANGDQYYTEQFARAGYPSPFPGDGYYAELIDPCCDTINEKAYGQTFGVGQGHQWPAARLGGVLPPSPVTVPVTINLAGAGAASAVAVVTQPSSAQQQYSCPASPCLIEVDQRQGAPWVQIEYLSASGAVISTTAPTLVTQLTSPGAPTTTTPANATVNWTASNATVTLSATVTSTAGTVNGGAVTFFVQGTQAASGTVANGTAAAVYTLPVSAAAGATYPISAVYYNAGGAFAGSSGNATLTVNAGPTTTTPASFTLPWSASGQPVALSATVTSPAGPVNVGTVTFTVLGAAVTSGAVFNGVATAMTSSANGSPVGAYTLPGGTAPGTYPIAAVYNASGNFGASSGRSTLTVTSAATATTTTVANASATFSASSQPVTLSATVTSTAGTVNAGTVTFTVQGTKVTSGTVANGAATAVYTLPAGTAAGSYPISAAYTPDGNFGASSGVSTLTVTSATAATITTAANASATFSASSQPVTLSARVTSTGGSVNAGTVTFTVQGTKASSGTVTSGAATAVYTLPAGTAAGSYPISAAYNTSGGFSGSTGGASLTVNPGLTTTTAANVTAAYSASSQPVTLSATVTSAAGKVNAGTVTFTVQGTEVTSGTVANGAATAVYTLPAGTAAASYPISASYNASTNFSGSSGTSNLTVTAATASTTTTTGNAAVTWSSSSQPVTLSATVTSTAGTVNVGTVTFAVQGIKVTSGTVTGGAATAVLTLPAGNPAGTYPISGVYSGGGNFSGSSGTSSLIVNAAADPPTTTTAVNASATWSTSSQPVTLSATVTSTSAVNVGTVTFTVQGTKVTSGTVTNGAATAVYTLPAGAAAGSYPITAAFNKTGNFGGSTGTSTLTVNPGPTTIAAANATATYNASSQLVMLSATVASTAGTVNAGTVTFTVQGTQIVSGTVANGAASIVYMLPAGTAAGSYPISAAYNAGANFSGSTGASSLTVSPGATTTTSANATATSSASTQPVTLSATVTSTAGTVNAGTVTFTVQGTKVTSGTVSNGAATAVYTLPAGAAAGSYPIAAAYHASANFAGSTGTSTLTVNSGTASTTTTPANITATYSTNSQLVMLSATVTSTAGTVNAGTVTFTVLGTQIVSGTVANGAASIVYMPPGGTAAGSYPISAVYNASGSFGGSTGTSSLTVSPGTTTTTSANATATSSASTRPVTLSATVTSTAGTVNAGTVTFTVQGTKVTSGTVSNGAATAVYTLPAGAAAGSYPISAAYNASANFAASTGTSTLTVDSGTASTITTPANATAIYSASSQPVTLAAEVTSTAGTVNAGTVTFTVLGIKVTSGTVLNGLATALTSLNGTTVGAYTLPAGTAPGTYAISAVYNPSGNLGASSGSSTLTVNPGPTTLAAANVTATFSASSQPVTLSATVTSTAGTLNAGTVTFTVQGTQVTSGTVSNGAATAVYTLPAGTPDASYPISAAYNGSANFSGSTGISSLTVNPGTATTTITAVNATATFSASSQPVTLSATVTSTSAVNVGTVTFTVQGTKVTSGTVTNGAATAVYTVPAGTAAGSYPISAAYTAGANFSGSTGTSSLTVSPGATTTTSASATATSSASTQPVTLSATVTSTAGTVNAGTVTFTVQGTKVTSGTVTNGAATAVYTLPAGAAAGSYPIAAVYSASANFAGSTGTSTLTVNSGTASTTTTPANITATYSSTSQLVMLSATVTSLAGTVNAGTVTFTVLGTQIVSGTVANGAVVVVYMPPGGTAAGSYPISAVYNASGSFGGSTGTSTLTVNPAPTTTTAANATATASTSTQPVTLSATVTSRAGAVNAGTVTFTVLGTQVTSGTVTNGAATAVYTLPAGTAAGSWPISAAYNASANFAGSTDSTHSLMVSGGGSGGSGSGYSYWRTITISHLKVPNTNQNNFPVFLTFSDPLLKSVSNGGHVASASGYDVIFTSDSAGNNLLPFQRESYNPATGGASFWVQAPMLSPTSDTQIYMFYGNSGATDQSNPSGVWDSNYKGVWHLNDDAANTSVGDSTSNAHNGTNYANTNGQSVAGQTGAALSYGNGSTNFGTSSDFDYSASNFTVSFWLNCPYFNGDGPQGFVGRGQISGSGSAGPYEGFEIFVGTAGFPLASTKLTFTSWDGYGYTQYTTAGAISATNWNYVTFVRNGSTYSWYLNGSQDSTGTFTSFQTSSQPLYLMKGIESGSFPGGDADEFRMSNTARSADWITTEYNNQSSPGTFYSVGAEQ
jgi:hypothetical protein